LKTNQRTEPMNKRVIFLDRDGTLIVEPPVDYQVDTLEKLEFIPGVFRNLFKLRAFTEFELVLVSNQDGLGTAAYPREAFDLVQDKFLTAFRNEDVTFDAVHIDPSMPEESSPNRKPGTGMLVRYLDQGYDLSGSYVIGDRVSDIELAANLGSKGILFAPPGGAAEKEMKEKGLADACVLVSDRWDEVYRFIRAAERSSKRTRRTKETEISVSLSLEGEGNTSIETGLGFFDHMLEQLGKHGGLDLEIRAVGDLHVDEHHTIEDTAITLGEAFREALGDKRGIGRYGFVLPMDDAKVTVAMDLGGRPWTEWDVEFKRERIGDVPTEMFFHFFKSFSDGAMCNLNIRAEGNNDHHKAEAIFKGFARAIRAAVKQDPESNALPSTKGIL